MKATSDPGPLAALEKVRTVAVVGVSGRKIKFGTSAFRELRKRGYEVYPVHPSLDRLDDVKCYRSVAALPIVPDCVFVSVKPDKAVAVVGEVVSRGARTIWFQQGADFSEAIDHARKAGLRVIGNRCILMYAEPVGGIHALHRFFARVFGKY